MKTFGTGILFIILFHPAFSQTGSLQIEIEKLKKDPELIHASWGLCVMNVKSGEVIASHNPETGLIPASTLKTITTATALQLLGSNYRYETLLQYVGTIDASGKLSGNIYIKGGGDPTLDSEYFLTEKDTSVIDKWVVAIRQAGITKIDGNIIADASVFEEDLAPPTWIWADLGNYFGIGPCGLTFRDNKYSIFLNSGPNTGDTTYITKTEPEIPGLKLRNYVRAGGSEDNAYIYGAPYLGTRYIKGTIPPGKKDFEIKGSLPDPAWFCAYTLLQKLKSSGITVNGEATTVRLQKQEGLIVPSRRTVLHKHFSPTLDKIVYYTNLKSNNLYAEHLLKTLALKKTGYGSWNQGLDLLKNHWSSKGLDASGLNISDGSGLSRANTVPVKLQAEILRNMAGDPSFAAFDSSLPVAGKNGSLSGMLKGTSAENNLRAKSGYINRVRSYCGYVNGKKGNLYCFSFILNNYDCSASEARKKMERVMKGLGELD